MVNELKRQANKREQILSVLRGNPKGVTNVELSSVSLRYGGHLGKLYEMGYKVEITPLGEGVFNYKLVSEPDEIIQREKAIDVLLNEVRKEENIDAGMLEILMDKLGISVRYKPNTYNV